jgi:hypothetical protein
LHQVPGVLVCPVHNSFLNETSARRIAGRKAQVYIPADTVIYPSTIRYLNLKKHEHRVLHQIAFDALWLLEHPIFGSERKALLGRYQRLLIEKGYAKYTGRIHVRSLLNEFKKHFSPTLLKKLQCEITGKDQEKANWLLTLVRRQVATHNPLYHLLLMQFLGCTAEEFFSLPVELELFGEGPWPCLNPAADHLHQLIIQSFTTRKSLCRGRPIGVFGCECGFTYTRTGPDTSPKDRFRIGSIASFGHIWEAKLRELWSDPTMSLKDIVGQLKSAKLTVRRHAARLKLYTSNPNRNLKPPNHKDELKCDHVIAAREQLRSDFRNKWLSVRKEKPTITFKELRHLLPREYVWIRKNDSEWMWKHSPKPRKRGASRSRVKWYQRDLKLASAVISSARKSKNSPSRPTRITTNSIGRDIGAISLLQQQLHLMPLTAAALKSITESDSDFAARRILWVTAQYVKEGVIPRRWEIVERACVYHLIKAKGVQENIDAALTNIKVRVDGESFSLNVQKVMCA